MLGGVRYFSKRMTQNTSDVINAMRFPLIVLVLMVHSPGTFPSDTMEWSLEGWNIFHYLTELISKHIGAIATSCFFLFSGYLFFWKSNEEEFSLGWVLAKWKKRIKTLLIPYLIWNLLMVVAMSLMKDLTTGPIHWFVTGPVNFPLWFLRDLIIMSALAPLLYLICIKLRWISLSALIIVYLSSLKTHIPSMNAIFFYGVGVWTATFKLDLSNFCRKAKTPAAIMAIILAVVSTALVGTPAHTAMLRLFIPFGIIAAWNICEKAIGNQKTKKILSQLSPSVFFIYAVHEIYLLGWTKGLCLRIFGDSLTGTWIRYWIVPLAVLIICLCLYNLLKKTMPRALTFACGGRTKE